MEFAEALEIVVAKTRHERYRELTDPAHPDYNPGYVSVVMAIADGRAGPVTTIGLAPQGCGGSVATQLANIARVKACPSWEATSTCGCGFNRCRAGKGRAEDNGVSYEDCFRCLSIGPHGIPK